MKRSVSLLILILLTGCAVNQAGRQPAIVSFQEKTILKPGIPVKKACWFELENTFYLWQQDSSLIHIYRNGEHINTTGGSGSDKLNIPKLADICLSPDGSIYLLDGFERRITRIDRKGKWIAEVDLPENIYPQLLAVSADETFFIYDDNEKEIIVINYSGKEVYRFGKMMFSEPLKLSLNNNIVSLYDKSDKTYFFTKLGQFLQEADGNCNLENNQVIRLEKYNLASGVSEGKFALNVLGWLDYYYEAPNYLLIDKDKITAGVLEYEERN